jgi:hypothetical protein
MAVHSANHDRPLPSGPASQCAHLNVRALRRGMTRCPSRCDRGSEIETARVRPAMGRTGGRGQETVRGAAQAVMHLDRIAHCLMLAFERAGLDPERWSPLRELVFLVRAVLRTAWTGEPLPDHVDVTRIAMLVGRATARVSTLIGCGPQWESTPTGNREHARKCQRHMTRKR